MEALKGLVDVQVGTVGTITTSAPLPASLAKIGIVMQGGVTIAEEDPKVTDFVEEGADAPFDQAAIRGKVKISFQMAITSADDLVAVRGGAKTGTTIKTFSDGDTFVLPVKGIKISTTTTNKYIGIPKGNLYGKYNGKLSADGSVVVDVTITPLASGVAGVPAVIVVFPA